MNLYDASRQWAERPDDERFFTLTEAREQAYAYHLAAREASVKLGTLNVHAEEGDPDLYLESATPRSDQVTLKFTHWFFGQLAARVGAPAGFLRKLPPTLAATNLNFLMNRAEAAGEDVNLLIHKNGGFVARAVTSDRYARIWNFEVLHRLIAVQDANPNWRVPPARPARPGQTGTRPATESDVLTIGGGGGVSVRVGDLIAPAGIYCSDHDMFVLLINEHNRIEDGSPGGLSRGVMISNSEVGAAVFRIVTFLFRHVCGNHIIWDASNVQEIKVKHIGHAPERAWRSVARDLVEYANEPASDTEAAIHQAQRYELADSKSGVIDLLYGKGWLSRKQADAAYMLAESNNENPRSAWGFVQGLTRLSQMTPYMDERTQLDYVARPILKMAL